MDDKVKEYKVLNGRCTVRIHGGQPDRKRMEEACSRFFKSAIASGISLDDTKKEDLDVRS